MAPARAKGRGASIRTRTQSAKKKKPQKRTKHRTLQAPSLLILHLDANKLRHDGLHLGEQAAFTSLLANHGLNAAVVLADTTNQEDLLRTLAELVEKKRTFDVLVAIGHSNSLGIRIAADTFVDWKALGEYLKPLGPRRLVLVACQAGQWPSARDIFLKLKKLRRLYASPVNARKSLAQFMLALAPVLLEVRVPRAKHVTWAQTAAIALTGGQIREWTRADMDSSDGLLLDLAAKMFDPVFRSIPATLRQMFTRRV